MMFRFLFFFLSIGITNITFCQTCCSGGIPLSNNIGLEFSEAKTALLGISYDFNNLNTLKKESETIDDNSNYNNSTWVYTVPSDGRYFIQVRILWDWSSVWTPVMQIKKWATEIMSTTEPTQTDPRHSLLYIGDFLSWDEITTTVIHYSWSNRSVDWSSRKETNIIIHKI